ncbi:hypothetical protein AGDE_13340 [Angomonas deanei]|nr:hypothetical protein AGDE_13340 [Angomonas deanei]|eukprot:EPY22443.1 hypothetical protein AGDE_13340 [Angomonas deanei]
MKGEVAVCETSRTTRQSLSRRRSSQAPPEPADYTPQLVTYRSHRGASPVSAEPEVDPARRLQLLETIQFYTKNAEDLDKGHLKAARECFLELFGQQRGLRQYSNWIDDLALQAIRSKK